jgi:hypothetical protein
MFQLFGLLFELVKISILGSIYASFLLLVFLVVGHFKPGSLFSKVLKKKMLFWFLSGSLISIGLFFFMFTFWGNHGLGDWARIPLDYKKQVIEVDGTRAYLQNTSYTYGDIEIEKFEFTKNFLCGKTGNTLTSYPGDYLVYNLITNEVTFYNDESTYAAFACTKGLPAINTFKNFSYHYNRYWNGWRFWLLP